MRGCDKQLELGTSLLTGRSQQLLIMQGVKALNGSAESTHRTDYDCLPFVADLSGNYLAEGIFVSERIGYTEHHTVISLW